MRTEFVYSIIALGAIPVVTNAADVQKISSQDISSETGAKVTYPVGKLVPGDYTFSAKLTSKVYDVKVKIAGKEVTINSANNPADPNVDIDFTIDKETDVELELVSTDPGESGAGFSVAEAVVILDFDFASIKSTLAGNADALAGIIGGYNYAAKEDDVKAANALKKKANDVAESYDDYKDFELYAEKSTIQKDIDALAEKAAEAEAAYQNEQAYNRVNDAITAIKAKYNAAVADLKAKLINEAEYLQADALADLGENINVKITEATQKSYASYTGKTAVADEATNIALVPTEEALNTIVNKWKEQGAANQAAYDALQQVVTDLQDDLDDVKVDDASLNDSFAKEREAVQNDINAINATVENVKNSAAQLDLDVSEAADAAEAKIKSLVEKVATANDEFNANKKTVAAIAVVQKAYDDAKTAVDAKKSKDGNYKASDYYAAYLQTQQDAIDKLTTDAATAYKVDGTGSAKAYNDGLAALTDPITAAINDYETNAVAAVDKYDALQTAIASYQADLDAARTKAEEVGKDVYNDADYDYKTKFDLLQKRINDIKKAITAAQEKVGAEHWTAMLAVEEDAAISTDIATLLSTVQADQNKYDAESLAEGMTTLEGKITAFQKKDASVLGADAETFQGVETGISNAYNAVKDAKDAINAQSETVEYLDNSMNAVASWTNAQNCPAGEFKTITNNGITTVQVFGVTGVGDVLNQELDVENGTYDIEVYATSHNAWDGQYGENKAGKPTLQEDANDVAYVYASSANEVKTWITAKRGSGLAEGEPIAYTIKGIKVENGKLKIGLSLAKAAQTEWHSISIKSLKANTASLIQGWGAKVKDLNNQQDALKKITDGVEAKVTANGAAKTALATNITNLKTKVGTFKDTYKVGDDANTTLGNRGKADGEVIKEVTAVETALSTLETANNAVTTTAVTNADKTASVGNTDTDWGGGYTAIQFSPKVTDAAGREQPMVENYNGSSCTVTGTIISQTLTGLNNGIYDVVLFANAMHANGVDNDNGITEDKTDVAYVFANDRKTYITAKNANNSLDGNGEYTINNVVVSEGKLTLGLGKDKAGTNWHNIQIKSLTYHENDQTATYNTAETGYNAQYTALAGRVTKLENDAPGIKTAVENNAKANTDAQKALTELGTYEVNNLKNLTDVSNPDGSYNDGANNSETGQGKGAKKSDPADWYVFKSDLAADKTYTAKKDAIDATITALTNAITAANAAETLPYPWADEITVTTEDDPATKDVNEASSTTYKISEIKATVDALKAEAADESANYWAYRNTNMSNIQAVTDAITAERTDLETSTGAGALDYYNGVLDDYEAEKQAIYADMLASLKARTAASKKDGWIADLKILRENKVKKVKTQAVANLAKYNEQKDAVTKTQTLWNSTYTEIAATDKSSERDNWLAELDAIQVTLTAAKDAVEANYPKGESVAKAQDFADITAKINDVSARQSAAYEVQIAADNKEAHESFMGYDKEDGTHVDGAIESATNTYQSAVQERARYSSSNESIKKAIDDAAEALDKVLFDCPTKITDLTATENDAYKNTVSPTVFDVSQFNADALAIETDIQTELANFKNSVKGAIDGYWKSAERKPAYVAALAAAETAIFGYSDEAKLNAFKDVSDLIAQGDAGVASIKLSEVEAAVAGLENIDDMLAADKDAAAKKDIAIAKSAAETAYSETKTYIEGKTIADDVNNVKKTQLENLEAAKKVADETLEAIPETDWAFDNHDDVKAAFTDVVTTATAAKAAVDAAIANDVKNTEAYEEIKDAISPVENKLKEAKAAAAGYKYQTSFATDEDDLAGIKADVDEAKANCDAVAAKGNLIDRINDLSTAIDGTLSTAHGIEKAGLAADISELKNQFNTYVANNKLNETATAFKKDIDELDAARTAAAIVEVDDPADGIKFNDILAATDALIKIQNDIADKQTELLAANESTANAEVLADFNNQIGELEKTASLEGYDTWVAEQPYGDTTLGEAITDLKAKIADLKTAVNAEKNISFYKDQYQEQLNAIKADLDPVAAEIAAKDAQFKANAAAYETLSAEINELQGKIDAAKTKVGAYEYAANMYFFLIENSYNGVLYSGAQYDLNQAKATIETKNANKSLTESSVVDNKVRIETAIQNYLDNSAYEELISQRGALNIDLTNAIDVNSHEGVQKYSPALWRRLLTEKDGIKDDILNLAKETYKSNVEYEGTFNVWTNWSSVFSLDGVRCEYYYTLKDGNRIEKARTCDADYDGQIAEVNRIKEEINNLGKAVDNLGLLGDANVDGKVNVLDYQKVVNMILDPTLQPEEDSDLFANIDINQNDVVEVGDLTSIVNYILNGDWQGYAAARSMNRGDNENLSLSYSSVESGVQRIAVNLKNANNYTAFQMDVVLPDGMKIVGTSLSSRAGESHKLYSHTQLDGSVRMLVSSVSGETFSGNEGAVLYIDVEGANASSVEILNILFSDVNANTREFRLGSNVTGIDAIGNTFDALKQKVYDLGGRVMNGVKKGISIIRNADGSTKKVAK